MCWAVRRRFPSLCWSESALDTSQEQLNFRDQGAIRRSEAQREPLTPRGNPDRSPMKPHGRQHPFSTCAGTRRPAALASEAGAWKVTASKFRTECNSKFGKKRGSRRARRCPRTGLHGLGSGSDGGFARQLDHFRLGMRLVDDSPGSTLYQNRCFGSPVRYPD